MKSIFSICLILMVSAFSLNAEIIKMGKGSYTNQPPKYVPGTRNVSFPDKSRPKNVSGPIIAEHAPVGKRWQMINPAVTERFRQSGKKITTNKWWSSLIFKFNGNSISEQMFPGPLSVYTTEKGMNIGIQRKIQAYDDFTTVRGSKDTNKVVQYTVSHIVNVWQRETFFGQKNLNADSVLVDDYGDWHVKAAWKQGNDIKMTATLSRGVPYVYFEDLKDNFKVTSNTRFSVWYEDEKMVAFRSESAERMNYVVFKPEGAEFIYHNKVNDIFNKFFFDSLEVDLKGKDYLSVAVIFDENAPLDGGEAVTKPITEYARYADAVENLNMLKRNAFSFIKDTRVVWKYEENTSNVISDFHFDMVAKEGTSTNTVMTLFPHQYNHLAGVNTFAKLKYPSPRGWLKTIEGNTFTTSIRNPGLLYQFPNVLNSSKGFNADMFKKYIDTLDMVNPNEMFPRGMDTYNDGKKMTKFGQALEAAGASTGKENFITNWGTRIKNRIEDWLTVTQSEMDAVSVGGANDTVGPGDYYLYYYNPKWQSIYGFPASFNSETEFNDHHFHWGYFIRAVVDMMMYQGADYGKDENWGAMTKMLIRDIAGDYRKVADGGISDNGDPLFPKYRNWDPYMGYALASGHSGFADGNNQESSSEGQHFNAAVALFGALSGDKYYRDLGIYMFTTQLASIDEYWFDVNNKNFWRTERPWLKVNGNYVETRDSLKFKYPFVGMNWDNKAEMLTWFSPVIELISGINFLPYTASSVYLGRNLTWMDDAYNNIVKLSKLDPDGYKPAWQNIIWQFLSLAKPDMALAQFNKWPDYVNDKQLNAEDHVNVGYKNYGENGTSKVYTYYWLHSMNAFGQVDTVVKTNSTPFYSVFVNNIKKLRTHVAFNPTSQPLNVTFSDGVSFSVPAHKTGMKSAAITAKVKKEIEEIQENPILVLMDFDTVDVGANRELIFTWCNSDTKDIVIDSVYEIISNNGFYVAYLDNDHTILPGYCYVGVIGFSPEKAGDAAEYLTFLFEDEIEDNGFVTLAHGVGRGGTNVESRPNIQISPEIRFYPNPAREMSTLVVESKRSEAENISVDLVNSAGMNLGNLYSGQLSHGSNSLNLDFNGINSGFYILSIDINGMKYSRKLIIAR
ncbi:MAG: glycosyl hydrolase [Candidatus Kapabacteria bacterium]|nr:glycosyl hydrolase [Candidatus Kapabacteria bacterium]